MKVSIGIVSLVTIVAMTNCSPFQAIGVGGSSSLSSIEPEIIAIAQAKTASVISSNRALDSMVSCLGTVAPSARSKSAFDENKGAISSDGAALSVSQPMLNALATVGAEVCNDLIQQERVMAANQRRIFPMIDFNAGPNAIGAAAIADTARRLSRSCWGRNETDAELQVIQSNVSAAFAGVPGTGANTVNQMVYICAAVVSSFAAYEM